MSTAAAPTIRTLAQRDRLGAGVILGGPGNHIDTSTAIARTCAAAAMLK
jgi:hypothetical protein